MNKYVLVFSFLCLTSYIFSQHTFSIVAVDTITGEVGSAGASCVDENDPEGGAIIISDLIPGLAALHTQGFYNKANQENYHNHVVEGIRSLESTITWLTQHDLENFFTFRQYAGVVLRNGKVEVQAVTGENVLPEKGEIAGPNYAIVGNILKNKEVLLNMQNGFLNATGTLADKLLGALRGAKEVGADSRCASKAVSSLSAFLRVAKPTDSTDQISLDLYVPSVPEFIDPIDSLLNLYDKWLLTSTGIEKIGEDQIMIYPNPVRSTLQIELKDQDYYNKLFEISDYFGRTILKGPLKKHINVGSSFKNGVYIFNVKSVEGAILHGQKIMILK